VVVPVSGLTVDALVAHEYREIRKDAGYPDEYLPVVLSEADKAEIRRSVNERLDTFPDLKWAVVHAVEDYEHKRFGEWLKKVSQ